MRGQGISPIIKSPLASPLSQHFHKFLSGHQFSSQAFQVRSFYLAINHLNFHGLQLPNGKYKGGFACIAYPCKHAFAKKYPTQPNPIKAAGQLAVFPCLKTVAITFFVKGGICLNQFGRNPGGAVLPLVDGTAAILHYFLKTLIMGKGKLPPS